MNNLLAAAVAYLKNPAIPDTVPDIAPDTAPAAFYIMFCCTGSACIIATLDKSIGDDCI